MCDSNYLSDPDDYPDDYEPYEPDDYPVNYSDTSGNVPEDYE